MTTSRRCPRACTPRHGRRAWAAAATAAVVALAACSAGTSLPEESVEVTPDSTHLAALGDTVRFNAVARDASGAEAPGAAVVWSSTAPTVASVDETGLATALSNGTAQVQATALGVTGSATLTVVQEPATMAIASGDAQSGLAREVLAAPLRVRVFDARGSPIPGLAVTWQVLVGGGSVAGDVSDATGQASGTWTLGPAEGAGSARAVAGPAEVTFNATALPNGVIQGTISLTNGFGAPPRAVAVAVLPGVTAPDDDAGPTPKSARAPPPTAWGAGGVATSLEQGALSRELLVRLRTSSLAIPAVGSPAYGSRAEAERAGVAVRSAAARWAEDAPLEVLGASPVLATVRVRVPPGADVGVVRDRLLGRAEVEAVEPNARVWRVADRGMSEAPAAARDEPLFPWQAWHYQMIDAYGAWEVTTGSGAVIVAVLDDGIRFDHPDIAPNLRSDGYDFVTDESLEACTAGSFSTAMDGDGPDRDPTTPAVLEYDFVEDCVVGFADEGGHGLHVAGTIGASAANGVAGVGLAWNVSIRPVRVLASDGAGALYDIAQGILYAAGLPADDGAGGTVQAASGARVINMSFGGTLLSTTVESAVQAATAAGALLFGAAGNDGALFAHYPAAYRDVVSVAAFVSPDQPASYSNRSPTIDIAAPGGTFSSAGDRGVWSLRWDFANGLPIHGSAIGTSMAVPHVAGTAALVLAQSPGLGVAQLRARLLDHATPHPSSIDPDDYGVGFLNASASVRSGGAAPADRYVYVVDAQTGAARASVAVSASGAYSLNALPDGTYRVYAGQDRNGDQRTGLFGRRWGALGASTYPVAVTIAQSSIASGNFTIGRPVETEPNGTLETVSSLPLGGYAYGNIGTFADVDVYRFTLDAQRTILVETDALLGACGLAGQVDTVARVLSADGTILAEHDDVDAALDRYCSRIVIDLAPGTYYVRVAGAGGHTGWYGVRVAGVP